MKIEARIFLWVATFFWVAATIYGIWTHTESGHIEWPASWR